MGLRLPALFNDPSGGEVAQGAAVALASGADAMECLANAAPWSLSDPKGELGVLLAAITLYHGTLFLVERSVHRNPKRVTEIYDVGHVVVPRLPTSRINDALVAAAAVWRVALGRSEAAAAWYVAWVSWGLVASATAHSVTWIGDKARAGPRGLWSNACMDRVVSNHTLNFGLALIALEAENGGPFAPLSTAAGCAAFGLSVVAAREHFSMDVVLSLWFLWMVRTMAVSACG
jgi:hypothetical protein